ncbi:MAG: M43 family zinc metalloprotease [Bacteroidia bacterium]|nr:M43 family zinc metalloprotease [Bacteroidia bacterium]
MYLILSGIIWAQSAICGTDEYFREIYPESELRRSLLESVMPVIEAQKKHSQPDCTPSEYVIPVVFHVIYSGPQDSISYSRIWNQLLRVNEDFRRIPETMGFASAGADMQIEFSLATKDPNGNPTNGVVYWKYNAPPLNWPSPNFCRTTQDFSMKQATGWPRSRYLNVWIVPNLCVNDGNGNCSECGLVAGYAFFPYVANSADTIRYGTVIGARYFWGSGNSRSIRTLVHELGHNLNLYHPFEAGCGTSNCQVSGDRVCDTPPTAVSEGNFTVRRQNTCMNDNPDLPDNTRNYMDYVDDASMSHFSEGQRVRSWNAIMNNSSLAARLVRPNVPQLTGTGPYGHVKAYFTASHRVGCVGQPIRFFSYSTGMPHIYQWDFGGGVADDPTSSCPTVTFPSPGTYTVMLIVENLSGRRDTLRKLNYIQIQDTVYSLPYAEGFEATTFPPKDSYVQNPDQNRTWERMYGNSPPRGAYGNSRTSMRLLFFQYGYYWERDSWISPLIDLRPYANTSDTIRMKFSWAYACLTYSGSVGSYTSHLLDYTDSLRVYISTDCGYTWTLLWERGGGDLATHPDKCITAIGTPNLSHQFLPTAGVWSTDSLSLDAYRGQLIRVRFEGVSGWGNNLFVDDIEIDTIHSIVPTTLPLKHNEIRAHIAEGALYLRAETPMDRISISLYDLHGRRLWQTEILPVTTETYRIPLPAELSEGAYLLRLATPRSLHTLRFAHIP